MAQKYLFKPPFLVKKSYIEQAFEITKAYRKYAELLHCQMVRKNRTAKRNYITTRWGLLDKIEGNFGDEIYTLSNGRKFYTPVGNFEMPEYIDSPELSEYAYSCLGTYNFAGATKNPYNYYNVNDLGLHQFFTGQKYTQEFQGDDSVYQPNCYYGMKRIRHGNGEIQYRIEIDPDKAQQLYNDNVELPFKIGDDFEVTEIFCKSVFRDYYWVGPSQRDEDWRRTSDPCTIVHTNHNVLLCILTNGTAIVSEGLFYADGDCQDQPIYLRGYVDNWDKYRSVVCVQNEDTGSWFSLFVPGLAMLAGMFIIIASLGTATTGVIGTMISIGGALSGASIIVTTIATIDGNSSLLKIGKIVGIVGAVVTLGANIANLCRTAASAVAESAKSGISAAGNATQNGLNQTAGTYLQTGSMNASGNGASNALSAGASSATTSGVETGFNLLKEGFGVIQKSIDIYSSVTELFKNPNDFDDDEIPADSDKSEEREAFYHYDNRLRIRSKYAAEDNTDLGLMEGSLGYLKSQLETPLNETKRLWEEPKTKVLPLVRQIDFFKKPYSTYKKAKRRA